MVTAINGYPWTHHDIGADAHLGSNEGIDSDPTSVTNLNGFAKHEVCTVLNIDSFAASPKQVPTT